MPHTRKPSRARRPAILATVASLGLLALGVPAVPASAASGPAGTAHTPAAAPASSWHDDLSVSQSGDVNVSLSKAGISVRSAAPRAETTVPGPAFGTAYLAQHALPAPADRVHVTAQVDEPVGSTVQISVRGELSGGRWTEWANADSAGDAVLAQAVSTVQARIMLTDSASGVSPTVSGLTESASSAPAAAAATTTTTTAQASTSPETYTVFATDEGLVGKTTANGHVIQANDHFVALPSATALSPLNSDEYEVKVCGPSACETAPVWDRGPWNENDDYWDPSSQRLEFNSLAQGTPEAQAAYDSGYNGGLDDLGTQVLNPAGIDLADGTFKDIGLTDNGYVSVTYLWTSAPTTPPADEFYQDIRSSTGGWQGWAPLHGANGAADFQGPAQATTAMPDGSSQVLGVGLTGLVYHNIRTASGPWDGWTALAGVGSAANFAVDTAYVAGSVAITDLPVASTSGVYGTSEMLAIGENDEVYYNSLNSAGTWSGFAEVPGLNGASGFLATKVGIAGEPDGSSVLTAFNTTNGDMYYMIRSAAGVWGAWTAVPGYNTAASFSGPDLAVAASPSGTVQFLAVGVDDLVYYNTLDPSTGVFSGWLRVAGYNGTADFQVISAYGSSSIGIAAMPDGSVQMTAIGLTDLIYHNILSSTGSWQGWDGLQGLTTGAFAAASVSITGMPDGSSQIIATTSN